MRVSSSRSAADHIVGVRPGYDVDSVLQSLETYPANVRRFDSLGNMFAATLTYADVISLMRNAAVEYVECDARVSVGK